jgi:hypothetical protein
LFATFGLYAESIRCIDAKNTIVFMFSNGRGGKARVKGIAFGLNQKYNQEIERTGVSPKGGFIIDIAYRVETNVYNGVVSVQAAVVDIKIPHICHKK